MSNKAELIIIIQNWLNLESQIKEASTALRELRKQKKLVSSELIKTMKDNEISQIDVKKGQIQYSKRKSRSALNKKMLESALADFFKETGDAFRNYFEPNLISFFSLFCSAASVIFCETDTLSENGSNTIYLPASDISVVNLGPLVDIGSLAICAKIRSPPFIASLILPSLLRLVSFLKCFNDAVFSF